MSTRERSRLAMFMATVAGMRAWRIAKALNTLTPGVDFRGLSKGALADEFVRGSHLRSVTRAQLRAAVAETVTPITPRSPGNGHS